MTQWKDLFLALPLPMGWLHVLLFVTFGLHLLFVLLMLGTAMIGFTLYLRACCGGDRSDLIWNRDLLKSHLGLKSLAVVLGVGPLLIIQVLYSFGFFTATGLYSLTWLAVIPLLILAFLCIELFEHKMLAAPWLPLLSGALGVGALLTVPAIFTGALALMERPADWAAFGAHHLGAAPLYLPHWLFRYLHVLGAALAFGAAFHLFFTARGDEVKKARMRRWFLGAMLFQVAAGVPLLFTVADVFNWPVLVAVTLGAAAAMLALWGLLPAANGVPRPATGLLLLLPVVFVAMLAARQYLQDGPLMALHTEARAQLTRESADLNRYREQALATFHAKLNTVYDNGKTIYAGSCQPCHGASGTGDGPAATRLLVPAEDLTSIRADAPYARALLLAGVPGSAMPYFTVFDRDKIDALLAELDSRFTLLGPTTVPGESVDKDATRVWSETCATCHGTQGEISDFGHTLRPAPPNLRRFSLEPERCYRIITDGYPGTVMQPYRDLPEDTRRDLVTLSAALRK